MQNFNFKKRVFKIILGLSIVFILIISNIFNSREFLKDNIYYYFKPVLAHSFKNGFEFRKTVDFVLNLPHIKEDIEKDKERIYKLESENAKLKTAEKENKKLRQILELPIAKDVKKNIADVIAKDFKTKNWLLIDKGYLEDVNNGDVVITAQNALVGFVYKVNKHSSYVKLITSEDNVFRVSLANKDIVAVAKGSHGNSIEVDYIDPTADIKDGDVFLYDNTENREVFFKKPSVGIVQDVIISDDKLSKKVQLTPFYNINSLSSVIIFHIKIDTK